MRKILQFKVLTIIILVITVVLSACAPTDYEPSDSGSEEQENIWDSSYHEDEKESQFTIVVKTNNVRVERFYDCDAVVPQQCHTGDFGDGGGISCVTIPEEKLSEACP